MRAIARALAIPLLAAVLADAGESARQETGPKSSPVPITWKGKSFTTDRLPPDLTGSARAAVLAWSDWAAQTDSRMDLDPSGRVLLASPRGNSKVDEQLELIVKTTVLYDALLPPARAASTPQKPAVPAAGTKPAQPEGPLPEDPETPPPGATAPTSSTPRPASGAKPGPDYTWGGASLKPDTQCAVMLIVKDEEEYSVTLDFLCKQEPYLKGWLESARGQIGFALELPLCGAYVQNASGIEEWSPENELVHRVMQLLVLRRFGQQPFWLSLGLSWHAELTVMKSIYCFPYREGFVGIGEHGGWSRDLANAFAKRAARPVDMDEFAGWQRGAWREDCARLAWGAVDCMRRFRPAALSPLLEDLRLYRDEHDKKQNRNGTWERIPTYEIPVDMQRELVAKHFGGKVFEEITMYWRTGGLPKPRTTQ